MVIHESIQESLKHQGYWTKLGVLGILLTEYDRKWKTKGKLLFFKYFK